MGHSFHLFI
uniref:Cullin n=1 Tax=Rhizophora mucronata TaxID=61149 RepID=A0A2P2Q4J0_RHIMU